LNKKMLIAIIVVAALVIIGIIVAAAMLFSNREGVVFNSGTFSTTSSGTTFSIGVHARDGRNGLFNVSNNSWRATPNTANGSSRVDYTFTTANLEAMTVRSTNAEGRISLIFTQGDVERTFDITRDFHENVDMSDFAPGRIRLRLEFENARNVDTLISWQ